MTFEEIYARAQQCSEGDIADNSRMLVYIVEEVGEVALALAVEDGLKDRELKETTPEECCDLLNSTLGLIARYGWTADDILAYQSKKLQKWEKRIDSGAQKR